MYITRYSCQIVMKLDFFFTYFRKKHSNIKSTENPSNGSRVASCRPTDGGTDGQTDMTKLIVAFHNFANAPKNRR